MKLKLTTLATSILALGMMSASYTVKAADYVVDNKGHASINFRVQHLGYSWTYGSFNDFDGKFSYDKAAPEKTTVVVNINTTSVDTHHAERDKHLRSDDFLNVDKFPEAKFVSTAYTAGEGEDGVLKGNLTLMGVTKPVEIGVTKMGEGKDPWGKYRAGFEGKTTFTMADFGIKNTLGPKSANVEMILSVEGIKQ